MFVTFTKKIPWPILSHIVFHNVKLHAVIFLLVIYYIDLYIYIALYFYVGLYINSIIFL